MVGQPDKPVRKNLAPLRRGVQALKVLAAETGWWTFGRLQKACGGLPAPTLSRLLKTLVEERLVERDPEHGRYRKGPALLELAHLVLGSMPKARIVQPVLDSLADRTGQSAAFFEFDRDAIVMVAKAERPNSCHYLDVGGRNTDVARHGFARAILAFMAPNDVRPVLDHAPHRSVLPRRELMALLGEIKLKGVCVERSESKPNWARVTAPVFGVRSDGVPHAIGITIVDAAEAGDLQVHTQAVMAAARQATELLGGYYAARIDNGKPGDAP